MYSRKIEVPQNYVIPAHPGNFSLSLQKFNQITYVLEVNDKSRWQEDDLLVPLISKAKETVIQGRMQKLVHTQVIGDSDLTLGISEMGQFSILEKDNEILATSGGIRVSGEKWLWQFFYHQDLRFYGMGQKNNGFEKSNLITRFYNTDIFADFSTEEIESGITDPMYISIPYLLIHSQGYWIALLMDNGKNSFLATGADINIVPNLNNGQERLFYIGSVGGPARLVISVSKDIQEVSRAIQHLMGTTPRPPLWSLGHHQSRCSYESWEELKGVLEQYRDAKIPLDSLWLDIDYMDNYKVFTWNEKNFPAPEKEIRNFQKQGVKIVPILDPGVKVEDGYRVYELGLSEGIFAKTPEGIPFTGFVWPGPTNFPDFTLKHARDWWGNYVSQFLEDGIDGVWIDMNEPATAFQSLDDFKFKHGAKNHEAFHNQYALGMQMATRQGFLLHSPDKRPFILSRSGFTASNNFSAQWTGDNVSNFYHLKTSIQMLLNLALSGVSFVGADIGGFSEDATDELLLRWYAASILLPFLRNHSSKGTRQQEVYQLSKTSRSFIRRFLELRYHFMPYLYQQFIAQEVHGLPITRPLFFEFPKEFERLEYCDDQFMIGESVLMAPILNEGARERNFLLPKGNWFALHNGSWYKKGEYQEEFGMGETAFFLRNKSIIPIKDNTDSIEISQVNFHIIMDEKSNSCRTCVYHHDDGQSFAYERGNESIIKIDAYREEDQLIVEVEIINDGFGPITARFTLYREFKKIILKQKHRRKKTLKLSPYKWKPFLQPIMLWRSTKYELGI